MYPPYLMSPWKEEPGVGGHTCDVCLKGDIPTPMLFAYRVLGIAPHQRYQILDMRKNNGSDGYVTHFSLGWAVGFGHEEPDSDDPFSASRFNKGATLSWVLGYVAGRYAAENGFNAPGCRFVDVSDHDLPEVGTFENYAYSVERQGKFPVDSLRSNPVARAMIKPLFDTDSPYAVAAQVIGQAVSAGAFDIETSFRPTDLHPSIVIWEIYIQNLDETVPGWFWANLKGQPDKLIQAALQRRIEITGTHGYQVGGVNFVRSGHNRIDPESGPVIELHPHRPRNQSHWDAGPA